MSRVVALQRLSGVLPCVLAVSCSLTLDPERKQCEADSDCARGGAGFASGMCREGFCVAEPKWSCLGRANAQRRDNGPFPVTLHIEDILSQKPLAGVEARLCRKLDVNCDNPLSDPVVSGDDGVVGFDVWVEDPELGFMGYVLLTRDDVMPGLYFFNPPIDRSVEVPAVQLAKQAVASVLVQQVGLPYEPERGLILLSAFDCEGEPTAGVMLQMDEAHQGAAPFYSVNGLPASTATATDSSGYGGVINAPAGTIALTGRLEDGERVVGKVSLLVKPGSITYSRMVPNGS